MKTLYFDESGFTGYNLLDPVQPIFVVSSSDIEPPIAEALLKECFPKYNGKEFKFSRIWNSNNRAGLIEFGRKVQALDGHAFSWVINKRFGVLTKIVDNLIEPYITDTGFDFYADGFCWKYCNYIHFGLTEFSEPELYEELLQAYQIFSRNPTEAALDLLSFRLNVMANSIGEPNNIFLEQMALGARLFNRYHNLENFKSTNELQVSSVLAIVSHWRSRFTEDFSVAHDASANFFRHRDIWERITNSNVPKQTHRNGDGSYTEFPLRVISTEPMPSEDNLSVQFCDIMAGLIGRHFDPRTTGDDRKLIDDVMNAGFGSHDWNGTRPELVFPDEIPPRRLEGPDIIDQMTEIINGPHND